MEKWLIENYGFQSQYAMFELDEEKFWRMFDAGLYEHCMRKYGAVGTFMSVYYKSKKGPTSEALEADGRMSYGGRALNKGEHRRSKGVSDEIGGEEKTVAIIARAFDLDGQNDGNLIFVKIGEDDMGRGVNYFGVK
uniref:Uncharacterized protein n=1 Tax=Cannabis sativa TaxID=3483 RepID=A0A803QSI1_CANSA